MQSQQSFTATAVSKSSTTDDPLIFLIDAESHREAWRKAREVCRTGEKVLVQSPETRELERRSFAPATYTVERVLTSGPHRRGRPPKLTADDLLRAVRRGSVKLPVRAKRALAELQKQL